MITIGNHPKATKSGLAKVLLLAALLMLAACQNAQVPDEGSHPSVVDTVPANGELDVALNETLRVSFDRAMDADATESAMHIVPATACIFGWNPGTTVLSCVPDGGWNADTAYTVTIDTTAHDVDDEPLEEPYVFGFTTGDTLLNTCVFGVGRFGGCVFGP